ncbi:hypothetical protein AcV7_007517 [Taiwanofungus camphoratus]|nr:hypothetical protein AcV7_007517 [Antrodia cinnamomea]
MLGAGWCPGQCKRDATVRASMPSAWCFSTPEERAWWGRLWADRMESSAFAQQALDGWHASKEELERTSKCGENGLSQKTVGSTSHKAKFYVVSDEATRKAKSTLHCYAVRFLLHRRKELLYSYLVRYE